ncbi:hypothetical protein J6590_094905 [Homalodisca vitripennis]|nr:hypothetical protein J6590_062403 [Homalodisca vitripennis]KAG8329097.1 hypothetical protein J6590_094905 [Homalodisca vitripennis]
MNIDDSIVVVAAYYTATSFISIGTGSLYHQRSGRGSGQSTLEEESPTIQAHFNSVALRHALRQEVDFGTDHRATVPCKVLLKLVKSMSELIKKIYGDDASSRTRVFEWHKMFKEGQEIVEGNHRIERPITLELMLRWLKWKQFCTLTIALISKETGLSVGTFHTIVTENRDKESVCKTGIESLSEEQTLLCVIISQENLDCVQEDEDFLTLLLAMNRGCSRRFLVSMNEKGVQGHLFDFIEAV